MKVLRTGEGQFVEVSEMDSSVLWRSDELLHGLNAGRWPDDNAPPFYLNSVRYQYYETKDQKYVIFQPFEWKFWQRFCEAIARPDLLLMTHNANPSQPNEMQDERGNQELHNELTTIMKTRTQHEWVNFFIAEDIPGAPQHSLEEVVQDEHFMTRGNLAPLEVPDIGTIQMPTNPIKLPGQTFETLPAPRVGQHNDAILRDVLSYDQERIDQLREETAIGTDL